MQTLNKNFLKHTNVTYLKNLSNLYFFITEDVALVELSPLECADC